MPINWQMVMGECICLFLERKVVTNLSEWVIEVAQSCPTLCNPMDCSLPCSSVHGISQARVLEWIAISFSNLDSILKSKDITLLTKVWLIKAMVFPVVMYECESWTIKKAECQRIDALNCGVGEDSWESLWLQGDQTSPS